VPLLIDHLLRDVAAVAAQLHLDEVAGDDARMKKVGTATPSSVGIVNARRLAT
jgi:hypothetical protein